MKKDKKVPSPESVANHIYNMMATPGWQIMIQYWNEERENIISQGKKGRSDESRMKMWAVNGGL